MAVDDAQRLDRASVDTLAFAAHRVDSHPIVVLLAARGTTVPTGFDRGVPEPAVGRLADQRLAQAT